MPMQVVAILGHELVHAAVGLAAGQGKAFRCVASGIGLIGRMAAATVGPEIREGHAADTGRGRAASTPQASVGRWRQQPFQPPQKTALWSDQVRL
jgi:hypothetical protein